MALESMRSQIEKGKAVKSKNKELKQHLRVMRENEDTLLRNIAELRRKLNPERASAAIQTDDDEVIVLREEHAISQQ